MACALYFTSDLVLSVELVQAFLGAALDKALAAVELRPRLFSGLVAAHLAPAQWLMLI